jgi:hypothetical protein
MGGYRWVPPEEYNTFDWLAFEKNEDMPEGYVVEVDLVYPDNTHFRHNNLPLAPEKRVLSSVDLSPYSKECLIKFKGKKNMLKHTSEKLCSTLEDKIKYACHYKNLGLYTRQGMIIKKVHRVIGFKQSPYIAKYIDLMTKKRTEAKTPFKKNLYKLACNSVYGRFVIT